MDLKDIRTNGKKKKKAFKQINYLKNPNFRA